MQCSSADYEQINPLQQLRKALRMFTCPNCNEASKDMSQAEPEKSLKCAAPSMSPGCPVSLYERCVNHHAVLLCEAE